MPPVPYSGDNLVRAITTGEIVTAFQQKKVVLGRIVLPDKACDRLNETLKKQGW